LDKRKEKNPRSIYNYGNLFISFPLNLEILKQKNIRTFPYQLYFLSSLNVAGPKICSKVHFKGNMILKIFQEGYLRFGYLRRT
jgi:hypothetical protein